MNIIAISDIHGNLNVIDEISDQIKESDLVIISGDITKKGTRLEAKEVLNHIEKYNSNILAVHGNIDRSEVIQLLEEKGYCIHNTFRIIDDIAFFGVGGSSPTPMNTPTEYSEEKIMEYLHNGFKDINSASHIVLVTHTPPRGKRDRTFLGLRGGSKSIKKFIKSNKIDLCLAGHIHEAHGVTNLEDCIVANSGSFKKGRYLSIEINGKIDICRQKVKTKKNSICSIAKKIIHTEAQSH